MMKNSIKIILFVAMGFSTSIFSQDRNLNLNDTINWTKIGEAVINYENNRIEIPVSNKSKFTNLRYVVMLAPVEIEELVVFYKNGDQQKFPLKETLKSEGYNEVLELNGVERIISTVVFQSYTIKSIRDTRAKIEVWGKNELK